MPNGSNCYDAYSTKLTSLHPESDRAQISAGHCEPPLWQEIETLPPFACFRSSSIADNTDDGWLWFDRPATLIRADSLVEIPAVLETLDAATADHRWAVALFAYESAPAFDSAMKTRPTGPGPLALCAVFDRPPIRTAELPPAPPDPDPPAWHAEMNATDHARAIRAVRQHIAAGHTYQVNLTFRLRGPAPRDPWALFRRLARAHPAPHAAWVALEDWIAASFSPELFFGVDGTEIVCRPMKGTSPRGRWIQEDDALRRELAGSEKNRAENIMIVDMVRNDLGRLAPPHTIQVAPLCVVETYRSVFQMVSTVRAQTTARPSAILKALFPCASVTGAPKIRTMEIIAELERSPRGLYCGTMGFIAPNRRMKFNVPIRTLIIYPPARVAEYGVGGGIVWDSSAKSEYAEAHDKALVLTRPDPPFDLLETLRWQLNRGLFLWREHFERLRRSAQYFGFPPPDEAELLRLIQEGVLACEAPLLRIRLRYHETGAAQVKIAPLTRNGPRALARIALDDRPTDVRIRWLYHKTTLRAVYEAARTRHPECDDVVLWNEAGEIMESTIANIVVFLDGEWRTPPIECGLLPGTMRARLLRRGCVREKRISLEDFRRAERILLVNSVRGLRPAQLIKP